MVYDTLLGKWTKRAWNDISPESITREFRKCCVLTDMNGLSDDNLWMADYEENSSSSEENIGND